MLSLLKVSGSQLLFKFAKSRFTGWMLLNYNKPVTVSSTLGNYSPNYAVDESVKTYWSAKTANKGEWLQSDLGTVSTVQAVQVNYADQDAEFLGKQTNMYHQYIIHYSLDGKKWNVLIDKSKNTRDVPHYFTIEAVNENGVSERIPIQKVE